MWSDWKEQIENQPKVRHSLLWEYDLNGFDWQYMRALVVERVVERGWDEDYYALFSLYGGMEGVRHTRAWVNYEIQKAAEQGKRIIGVYTHGSKETAELPKNLEKVASNLIGWNSIDKIGEIISGKNYPIENPDGRVVTDSFDRPIIRC